MGRSGHEEPVPFVRKLLIQGLPPSALCGSKLQGSEGRDGREHRGCAVRARAFVSDSHPGSRHAHHSTRELFRAREGNAGRPFLLRGWPEEARGWWLLTSQQKRGSWGSGWARGRKSPFAEELLVEREVRAGCFPGLRAAPGAPTAAAVPALRAGPALVAGGPRSVHLRSPRAEAGVRPPRPRLRGKGRAMQTRGGAPAGARWDPPTGVKFLGKAGAGEQLRTGV